MIYNLKNEKIAILNESVEYTFPKYTSQLINWANQNAQATRPRVVGQLSEIFPEFMRQAQCVTLDNWKEYYLTKYPNAINEATEKLYAQIVSLSKAMQLIDQNMVKHWVEDLIYNKTFNGLYVQGAILASLAELKRVAYRLATPEEEAKGIDGYVGNTPYSIKPISYKTMGRLSEQINVNMIYYEKTKTGLRIEVED